jgi:hypothetical protein
VALNQSAVNVEVVNGSAGGTVFTKALSVVTSATASFLRGIGALKTITSTSSVLITQALTYAKSLLASSTSVVTIVRAFDKIITLINVLSTATINLVTIFSRILSATSSSTVTLIKEIGLLITSSIVSSIVTIAQQLSYLKTLSVTSIVIPILQRYFSKIILEVQVVAATILLATNRLITLLAYSSTSVTITKAIDKTIDLVVSIVTSTLTKTLALIKTLSISVSSLVTLVVARFYFRTLTVVSSVTATVNKFFNNVLTISVNCGIILSRAVNKTLSVLSTVIPQLVVAAIFLLIFPVDRIIYAAERIRNVTIIKFRTIFADKDTRA